MTYNHHETTPWQCWVIRNINFSNIFEASAPFGFKLQLLDAYYRPLSVSIPFVFLLQWGRGVFFSALPFSCQWLSRRVTLAKNNVNSSPRWTNNSPWCAGKWHYELVTLQQPLSNFKFLFVPESKNLNQLVQLSAHQRSHAGGSGSQVVPVLSNHLTY